MLHMFLWFLIIQILWNWINQKKKKKKKKKKTTLLTYSLECDRIKLSQFVCVHFELKKKKKKKKVRNWSQPLSNCS